jgi:hypothetical protein
MARKDNKGKSIRFYRNKTQAIAANVYLMLYLKPAIAHYCQDTELLLDRIFELLQILDQQDLVHQGRTYGGGLDKIEPNELSNVVLPQVEEVERVTYLLKPLLMASDSSLWGMQSKSLT